MLSKKGEPACKTEFKAFLTILEGKNLVKKSNVNLIVWKNTELILLV